MRASLALVPGVGAVLAGVLVTPAGAAPLAAGQLYRDAYTYAYETGCVASDPVLTSQRTVPATGQPVVDTLDARTTIAKPGGPVSTIDLDATATAKLVARTGTFSSFDLTGRGRTTVTSPTGQTCTAAARAQHEIGADVTFSQPVWISARTTSGAGTGTWIDVRSNNTGDQPYSLYSDAGGGSSSATWYLTPGEYRVTAALNWYHYAAAGTVGGTTAGTGAVHLEAHPAGSALAAPAGPGRSYLTPGAAVNCAAATLPTAFTSRGGRVTSATYYVNGVRKKVVRNPAAGRKVTLTGMPKYRRNDLRVRLVVHPPGTARTATVTVTRSYRACLPVF